MKRNFKISKVLCGALLLSASFTLVGCNKDDNVIMIWGPEEHRAMYTELAEQFKKENPSCNARFEFAAQGDAGAYANMSIDPQAGGSIVSYPNDQLNNLNRIGAVAPILGENLTWIKEKNTEATVEAGKIGDTYYGYPIQGDNGYYMYFNRDAFINTSVWDTATDSLKNDYTFRDLYKALDEKGGKWANGQVSWAIGDSWYVSGVFFGAGANYDVRYNEEGEQIASTNTFGFEGEDMKTGDFTKGLHAVEALKNSFTTEDGKLSPHYMYSDADKAALNDNISKYKTDAEKPLAAVICGTWKAKEIQEAWGDNYDATLLPMLEGKDGVKFRMKTFAGYKLLGVNPLCKYASKSEENLMMLHKAARFFSDYDSQIKRYDITGAGPSNKEALASEKISKDVALQALNAQYDVACTDAKGQDNGKGYRSQDSVPQNYWTPIQAFGAALYNEVTSGKGTQFNTEANTKITLAQLQADISAASK